MGRSQRGGYPSSSRTVDELSPPKTANRTCESCGGAMANRQSRQRNEKGQLVCDSCKGNPQPEWTTTHGSLSILDQSEMRRREAEAITSIVRVRKAKHTGRSVLAHDSGDQAVINHCPFCGSGAVVGNSDGSAACDFCHSSFTVQVQPAHPFMPQTIDGESVVPPGMPGGEETELSAPSDPAVEEDGEDVATDPLGDADPNPPSNAEKPFPPKKPAPKKPSGGGNQPPWLKNKSSSFRTADGRTLDTEAYMARLALENADDRDAVLDQVRMANTQREAASVTCWRCKGEGDTSNGVECDVCGGTGLLDEKTASEEHGTTFSSWFVTGEWPKCKCGFDPKDNAALREHYREHGFEEYDDHGQIKRRPVTSAKTATLLDCPICQGTGEVEDKVNEREPSLTTYKSCTKCRGEGKVDVNDPEHFDLREPPHEAKRVVPPFSRTAEAESTPTPSALFGTDDNRKANNEDRAYDKGLTPCTTCGRGVAKGRGWVVTVINGGANIAKPGSNPDETDSGYMGGWLLGPECAKAVPIEFREKADDWWYES